jgi:aryl-alcohol dehydrogenase-like predicted oxidoreductase
MRYKYLGNTGLRVSTISLGTGPFGVAPLAEDAPALVHRALDLGINFIDTANSYGNFARIDRPGAPPAAARESAETIVGRALRGRRDEVVLATKVREVVGTGVLDVGLSRRHVMQQVERSLRALQTDYIDLYHLHGPDPRTPIDQTLRTMDDLVRQGKVRYIGLSNFSAWRLATALGEARTLGTELPVVNQIGYNLVSREAEQDIIPAARHFGLSVTTYGSLNGGLLAGTDILSRPIVGLQRFREDKSERVPFPEPQLEAARGLEKLADERGVPAAHLALAWLMAHDFHASAIIGPESVAELEASVGAADLSLTAEDKAALDALLPPAPAFEQLYDGAMAEQADALTR